MSQHGRSDTFREDKEVILTAMAQHGGHGTSVLRYVSEDFIEEDEDENDGEFLLQAKKVALLAEIQRVRAFS
jgi:hypothetical protein